ncbi:MAG: PIN domain-containing protein [Candidatus Gracilibacteria bacterium]|jgi:predicted nucleic acid-binding protein
MVILDTSFLFAFFNETDEHHAEAVRLTPSLEGDLIYFPFLVFQELMTLIMSRYSSSEAVRISEILLDGEFPAQIFKVDIDYLKESVALFRELGQHKLSFVDVSLIVLAREFSAKVITFDRGLKTALQKSI